MVQQEKKRDTDDLKMKRRWRIITLVTMLIGLVLWLSIPAFMAQNRYLGRGIGQLADVPIEQDGGLALGVTLSLDARTPTEMDQILAELAELEVEAIQHLFSFSTDPARFDWEKSDQIFGALADYPTIKLTPLLDGDPSTGYAPPDIDAFAAWAGAFAARYGDQIDHYIIWDEPNITSHWGNLPVNPDEYGALLAAARAAIAEQDPTARFILAPLAPTTETNLMNQAEPIFLQALYDNETVDLVDIVAAKPYGFATSPLDRRVDIDVLNFSRVILMREVMVANGDADKPIWATHWNWNALPANWEGAPSIWGRVAPVEREQYLHDAYFRVAGEWPWMGHMFLHEWAPVYEPDDPRLGFGIDADTITPLLRLADAPVATAGFYSPEPAASPFEFEGEWRFSPDFGADLSQKEDLDPPDRFTFTFIGDEIGLRVRRANYRARFNVLIDGKPANELPFDDLTFEPENRGSALVLNTNDPDLDEIVTVPVASGLGPGRHVMEVTGHRGWDQWALKGVVVANTPPAMAAWEIALFGLLGLLCIGMGIYLWPRAAWGEVSGPLRGLFERASQGWQLLTVTVAALFLTLFGFLTWNWGESGIIRRFGDGSQLAVIGFLALVFYVTPFFYLYLIALIALFWLLLQRPAWGLVLSAFVFPFYVAQTLKPIYVYRFSPVEIFTLLTFAAVMVYWGRDVSERIQATGLSLPVIQAPRRPTDLAVLLFFTVATLSLIFTERLDVATNEWRTVILGPILYYISFRILLFKESAKDQEESKQIILWIVGALLTSGLFVALLGLGQYLFGINLITAEGGLMRLRAHYGSPNNVALYLGRLLPIVAAATLLGWVSAHNNEPHKSRFTPFYFSLRPIVKNLGMAGILLAAALLTFSKGGLFLGIPAGLGVVGLLFLRSQSKPIWPWLILGVGGLVGLYVVSLQIPALAGRLSFFGQTGDFRINLWRSSISLIRERPWWGVGLDNFLYAYRGRYILSTAWQEPNLNHPHNILFDFLTRLGIFGLISGLFLYWRFAHHLLQALKNRVGQSNVWQALTIGLVGSLSAILAHGLVDHNLFLVDLSFLFFCFLAMAAWLDNLSGT